MPETGIRIITRGDDLGSFRAANAAILDAYKHGILRNTSIMVPAPYFEEAAEMVKNEKGLCLGLHVTLNAEWDAPRWGPLLAPEQVASLVDGEGNFLRSPADTFQHGVKLDEILLEVQAQLDKARAHGLDIRYIDEHMGISWFHNEGETVRLEEKLRALAQREGLHWYKDRHQHFIHLDIAKQTPQEALLDWIAQEHEPGTYLLVTHPAYDNAETRSVSNIDYPAGRVARSRFADYQMLCAPQVIQALKERNMEAVRYDED